MARRTIILSTFLILGFVGIAVFVAPAGAAAAREEPLHGFSVERETVSIIVTSNGCTSAADFRFLVRRKGPGRTDVSVIRIEPDTCEAVPQAITIEFSRVDIGLAGTSPLSVQNLFVRAPLFGLPAAGD